jgi:Mrp family chromosome partitioning ATPase
MPRLFNFLKRRPGVVRTLDDASALGLPVLGSISDFDPRPGARLPEEDYPEALEACRKLTDKIRGPDFHVRGRAIVVAGVEPGVGKSTTAKNLATLLARGGGKVILVDANLNRVARRRIGDGTSSSGFAGLLVNQLRLPSNALVHTMDPRLKLLPAGSTSAAADELFQSSRLPLVVEALRDLADYVVFDAAPLSQDLRRLTHVSDVTLMVVKSGSSRKKAGRAIAMLREGNMGLYGTVLNRAPVLKTAPRVEQPTPAVMTAPAAPALAGVPAQTKATEQRLALAVEDLLADLEASLKLIRDIKKVSRVKAADKKEDAELVTADR